MLMEIHKLELTTDNDWEVSGGVVTQTNYQINDVDKQTPEDVDGTG